MFRFLHHTAKQARACKCLNKFFMLCQHVPKLFLPFSEETRNIIIYTKCMNVVQRLSFSCLRLEELISIIFPLLPLPLSISSRLFSNWCRRTSINILMSPDGDRTNKVLPELLNALTKATNFVSASLWSLTNELILEVLVDVILVHQLFLEKDTVSWCRFCFSSMIASSNRLKSIYLFWPFLRKFGISEGNRMLVDLRAYLLPSPQILLLPLLMLLDR